MAVTVLGIESSCDDTSAAVLQDGVILSMTTATQAIHQKYGGVIPELASRAHQSNIVPTVDVALKQAGISLSAVDAIAFTRGPGLLGSLLVGTSFAKGLAIAQNIPLIEVNHLQAHVLALFAQDKDSPHALPDFPFLTLLVSGGHTQIILVEDYLSMKILGSTIDDAAGEAFDKCAKIMQLPYPGGPEIDRLAQHGNAGRFSFAKPRIKKLDYSFSGFKTSFLYFLRDQLVDNPQFIKDNLEDLAASVQETIIAILLSKFEQAIVETGVKDIAIAGGVAANSGLRNAVEQLAEKHHLRAFLPERRYTTDNAAMIAVVGYRKYLENQFVPIDIEPLARYSV
jgi:N6-L-threonylcarbamoyladenine synthase